MNENVRAFGAKLADWKRRLGECDVHSTSAQISTLLWRSAFYRSVNESRRVLPCDRDGGKREVARFTS